MPVLNILVAFNGSASSISALKYAAALAHKDRAYVTAILAHTSHEVIDRKHRWIPAQAAALIANANDEVIEKIEAKFVELSSELELGDRLLFRKTTGRVDDLLAQTARSFDMLIVGQHLDDDDEHITLHPDRIALISGRPVVVVPTDFSLSGTHSHVAVAWDGGRAAARAVSDSLRILEDEGKVSLLTVRGASNPPVDDLLQHLSRHGTDAIHHDLPRVTSIGDALVNFCKRQDATLLVMGAYEHSKFREDFLGGVTATVLREIKIPVLLSH